MKKEALYSYRIINKRHGPLHTGHGLLNPDLLLTRDCMWRLLSVTEAVKI